MKLPWHHPALGRCTCGTPMSPLLDPKTGEAMTMPDGRLVVACEHCDSVCRPKPYPCPECASLGITRNTLR